MVEKEHYECAQGHVQVSVTIRFSQGWRGDLSLSGAPQRTLGRRFRRAGLAEDSLSVSDWSSSRPRTPFAVIHVAIVVINVTVAAAVARVRGGIRIGRSR